MTDTAHNLADNWMAPDPNACVKVTNNIAKAFQATPQNTGRWQELTDAHSQIYSPCTHSTNTIQTAHA
ncbi:hypothetical protein [Streptomyces sp. NPDC096013]|uniref:hypothetical protein n=1 Tax=Streptomyces sp. NPDC096013 TaxID=3366069 RepID=UPI00381B4DB7